jgi:polyisoprenoid-binding protein YceI
MPTQPAPGRFTLDAANSSVRFHNKTFWGLATVHGTFGSVRGSGEVAADGTGHGTLIIDAASLDTKNKKRDTHLRSKDFFLADDFPEITFEATEITPSDDGTAKVDGELTVRGISHKLSFSARHEAQSPTEVVLRGTVDVSRADYDMTWNQLGMLAGTASIELELRFTAAG